MARVHWLLPAAPAQGGSGERGDVNGGRGEPARGEAAASRHRCDRGRQKLDRSLLLEPRVEPRCIVSIRQAAEERATRQQAP